MADKEEDKPVSTLAAGGADAEEKTSLADLEQELGDAVSKVKLPGEAPDEDPQGEEDATGEPEAGEATEEDPQGEEEAPEAEADPEGEQGRDGKGKFTRKAPLSDALLERAVKAGIPMSEARQYPNEGLLSANVTRLEGVQKNTAAEAKPGGDKKGKGGEAKPAETDPVAAIDAIPDLSAEVYDEGLVKAFASMKAVAKAQAQELAALRGKGSKDFMAEQLAGVKDFTKGDQSKETAVVKKFDALKAGYKATGADVSDVSVFAEAAQLVLGGDMKAAAKKDKTEAAGRRSGQRISRAAGQRVAAKADPIAAAGEEVHAAFFKP